MKKRQKVFALMYHDVVRDNDFAASGFADASRIYKMDAEDFIAHIHAIGKKVNNSPVDVHEIENSCDDGAGLFMMTFDDGGLSASMEIAQALDHVGWKGHFFITTGMIGKKGFMNADQIAQLSRRGHIIGSHSHTHPHVMSSLGEAELNREWKDSMKCLSEITGEVIDTASVPGGYNSVAVTRAAAKQGIKYLFTSEPASTVRHVDECAIIGRYSISRGTRASEAAAVAAGDIAPRLKQKITWNAKKAAKTLGGSHYLEIRKIILRMLGDR